MTISEQLRELLAGVMEYPGSDIYALSDFMLEHAAHFATLDARVERMTGELQIIANPDWTWATAAEMRELARAALQERPK